MISTFTLVAMVTFVAKFTLATMVGCLGYHGYRADSCGQTDGQTRPAPYETLPCTSCKYRIIIGTTVLM
jgi:hypothetical protein